LGCHHGFFVRSPASPEQRQMTEEINRLKPNRLILGFDLPAQERLHPGQLAAAGCQRRFTRRVAVRLCDRRGSPRLTLGNRPLVRMTGEPAD